LTNDTPYAILDKQKIVIKNCIYLFYYSSDKIDIITNSLTSARLNVPEVGGKGTAHYTLHTPTLEPVITIDK
jgi:hypothetical protein